MRSEKLLCLLQLLHAVYGECPVQLHPSSVVVRYGSSASANCTMSEGHLGIGWEASEGSVDMVTDDQFLTWTVENLTDWHIEPKCFGNFTEIDQCEEALQVTLYKTPDSVSISSVDHTSPMVEGRQYQLQCEVQNIAPVQNLTVKWYRGETEITEGESSFNNTTKTPMNVSSTLTITPSRADDGAQYSCVAELELGPEGPQPPPEVTSEPLKITVHYGECPVQLHPSSLVVRYGGSASTNCTMSEDHLGIGWEASEGSVDMEQDVQFLTWRVENLTDWHIEPKCYVNFNNDIGQCLEALQVTLYKTPDSVSIRSVDHSGPMVEGRQYQLQCEVQNIAPVQNLTVKWYRGETEITEGESSFNNVTKTPMNVSSTLTITPSRADDGAQYSCVAELELGPEGPQPPPEVTSEPLKITVHYKPSITKCPNQEELKEGDSLGAVLDIAEGNPAPRVTWYRDQSQVNSATSLTRKDSGQYVLTARNSLGSSNCTLSLTVGYAPKFSCNYSYEVTEKQSYTLNCTAEGYPAPEVTWWKQGEKVELPAHLDRKHAGLYTLIANNTYGTANHTLEIKVLMSPAAPPPVHVIIILAVLALLFLLVVVPIVYIRRLKRRGRYNIAPIHSAASRDPTQIPLTPLISNGTHPGT
ncbi:hypothetical protein MATL_G00220060 [Megalops atlanticus]|uniref:Ig-like domain-containing protein n=1 Tax=Megalops atlanticus TaxID=7932 RepID=A0A9D3T4H5_MEGAT|nr:hypothetical protein MATL_G00220060 [Megalops atlanticus]